MSTNAYTTAAAAVRRSISHDCIARVALDETLSGIDTKIEAMIEELQPLGLEDYVEHTADAVLDAWGTDAEGNEWRVYALDGLTQSLTYVD